MGKINMGRVIGGGLLAGLVMNISEFVLHAIVLRADGEAVMADLNSRGYNVNVTAIQLAASGAAR